MEGHGWEVRMLFMYDDVNAGRFAMAHHMDTQSWPIRSVFFPYY